MAFRRSFSSDSWWNKPIPGSVPVDPKSAAMIKAQATRCPPPTVGSPNGGWAMPWSEGIRGNLVTVTDGSKSVKINIDPNVGSMAGDDAAIVWRDFLTGVEISTFESVVSYTRDGKVDLSKPIRCKAFGIFKIDSNGLTRQVGGDKMNNGHRGIPPSAMALHPDELGSPILHRLKIALGQPADHPGPNFPMYGIESPRNGGIPEGAVIRLKNPRSGDVLQQNAHDFGFIVGDTAAPGKSVVKAVQGGQYESRVMQSLDNLDWGDWEVMKLGWK
jgi:hypothetical protein